MVTLNLSRSRSLVKVTESSICTASHAKDIIPEIRLKIHPVVVLKPSKVILVTLTLSRSRSLVKVTESSICTAPYTTDMIPEIRLKIHPVVFLKPSIECPGRIIIRRIKIRKTSKINIDHDRISWSIKIRKTSKINIDHDRISWSITRRLQSQVTVYDRP